MQYYRVEQEFPSAAGSAVTLGKFDGLHRGHRRLIGELLANAPGNVPVVMIAFDTGDKMLLSREERCRMAEGLGIDLLIECPLTDRFRSMKAETFVRAVLMDRLHVRTLAAGEDFRFGYRRMGTPELLVRLGEQAGFRVDIVPGEMDGSRKISSSTIRKELSDGNMERVSDLMGSHFAVEGNILHGAGLGHRKLLPTINLIPDERKRMPPCGVYFSRSEVDGRLFSGITNVGFKPTVDGRFLGVETYLFDCSEEMYGHDCRTELLHFHRPELRFGSLEELKEQLLKDAENGRQFFHSYGGHKEEK